MLVTAVGALLVQMRGLKAQAAAQGQKLEAIHGLVKSTLNVSASSDVEATRRSLAVMTELVSAHQQAGIAAAPETIAAIAAARVKLDSLDQAAEGTATSGGPAADPALPPLPEGRRR